MRHYILPAILVVAGSILLPACSKEKQDNTNTAKFEELKKLPGASARRTAFQELSNVEKSEFWRYWIGKGMSALNPSQKKLVSEIYQKINPALYDKNSPEHLVFTTLTLPSWLKQAEALLSKNKIAELFYFLEGETVTFENPALSNKPDQVLPKYDEKAPDCPCNIGSSYTCKKRTIRVSIKGPEIVDEFGSCTYSVNSFICDRDDWGCGWGGIWACNGNLCLY